MSDVLYWLTAVPDLYNTFFSYVTSTGEYGVENTHSIIRPKTKSYDAIPELFKKVKAMFYDKENLRNF